MISLSKRLAVAAPAALGMVLTAALMAHSVAASMP